MHSTFKEMQAFDNNGISLNFKKQMKSFVEYATQFKLIYLKGNPSKKRIPMFVCFHQIRSAFTINKIQNHQDINHFLNTHKMRLNNHEWEETIPVYPILDFSIP